MLPFGSTNASAAFEHATHVPLECFESSFFAYFGRWFFHIRKTRLPDSDQERIRSES
jgi:hypothetical protein